MVWAVVVVGRADARAVGVGLMAVWQARRRPLLSVLFVLWPSPTSVWAARKRPWSPGKFSCILDRSSDCSLLEFSLLKLDFCSGCQIDVPFVHA